MVLTGKEEALVSGDLRFGLVKSLQGDKKIPPGFSMITFRVISFITSSRRLRVKLLSK